MMIRVIAVSLLSVLLSAVRVATSAAPGAPPEPAIKQAARIVKKQELRIEGPVLAGLKQRDPALEGINYVVLRRYAPEGAAAASGGILESAVKHYAAEMERLGWYTLLTDATGRRKGTAYSSPEGDWLLAVNTDPRGMVTCLINGTISLDQMPRLEFIVLKMLSTDPPALPTAEDMETLRRAELLARDGKTSEAQQALETALAKSPGSVLLRRKLAGIYREQKRGTDALAQLKAVVALEPAAYWARMDYARALYDEGDHQAAVFQFSQAAALAPDKGTPRYFAGRCYQATGKLDQALTAYSAPARLAPHWSSVQIRMGEVLEAQGKPGDAAACFRKALKADPNSSAAKEALDRVTRKQDGGK